MATHKKKLGILVGGGPAPGINSVIAAATIRANLDGVAVLGIEEGFKWLMLGDVSRARELTIEQVSRIHFRGGSTLGTARDNPTNDTKLLESVVTSLLRLNIDKLISSGRPDPRRPRAEDHRQRPRLAARHPDLRLSDGA
jgi:6-phosphofructokinase